MGQIMGADEDDEAREEGEKLGSIGEGENDNYSEEDDA